MLTDSEKHKLLVDWDFTMVGVREDTCLHTLFLRRAEEAPNAIALTFRGHPVGYADLAETSGRIARALTSLGLTRGSPVAVMMDTSPRAIAALFGILRAGGAFVCLDPQHPAGRLRQILDMVKPACILSASGALVDHAALFDQYIDQHQCSVVALDAPRTALAGFAMLERFHGAELISSQSPDTALPVIDAGELAYVAFTSGSMGRPKGVLHSHSSFGRFLSWYAAAFGIGPGQRVGQWTAITFDPSYCELFGALCHGATLCLADPETRNDPRAVMEWLRSERVTLFEVVPTFLRELIELIESDPHSMSGDPLPALQHLSSLGERLPIEVARRVLAAFPERLHFWNQYGPTETVLAAYGRVQQDLIERGRIVLDRPIDGCQILILDDARELCPIGMPGEIYLRTRSRAWGYYDNAKETAQTFVPNPFQSVPPHSLYRTGDVGRWWPDGRLEILGRTDHQVKIRGVRIELDEIERVLLRHPAVSECVVVPRYLEGRAPDQRD
jgi:amino acid adenylation domain-containing protein